MVSWIVVHNGQTMRDGHRKIGTKTNLVPLHEALITELHDFTIMHNQATHEHMILPPSHEHFCYFLPCLGEYRDITDIQQKSQWYHSTLVIWLVEVFIVMEESLHSWVQLVLTAKKHIASISGRDNKKS